MSKINVLDKLTINRIAAGEVIERPASVVKELVENSIDAGATAITCEIAGGGTDLIRITDNGSGIERDDVRTAFLRHATSKIKNADDLESVLSLGFRGEALASIAAVASVEIITKTRSAFAGTRYCICDGEELAFEDVGCPDGTTIIVRDLFKNIPARRKFLKSAMTEGSYISEVMERIAVSHPGVSFKYINNSKNAMFTNGSNSVKNIIFALYGKETASQLIEVNDETDGVKATGFIGKPVIARGNRALENYFVNGRFVRDKIITRAIEDAYSSYMMQHKYPFTALSFTIPTDRLDINVHPAKQEIRFANGEEIYHAVYHILLNALRRPAMIVDAADPEKESTEKPDRGIKDKNKRLPEPFELKGGLKPSEEALFEPDRRRTVQTESEREKDIPVITEETPGKTPEKTEKTPEKTEAVFVKAETLSQRTKTVPEETGIITEAAQTPTGKTETVTGEEVKAETGEELKAETGSVTVTGKKQETGRQLVFSNIEEGASIDGTVREETDKEFRKGLTDGYQIVGQVFNTYWIVQRGDEMYIIDQHAAHEKIIYESLMNQNEQADTAMQLISPPMIISLSAVECRIVEEHLADIEACGFALEEFGGREYSVSAVPAQLYGLDERSLLMEIIASFLSENGGKNRQVISLKERLATCSCKAAVKGNTRLSSEEAKKLIEQLLKLENPFNCPHGRPVIVSMSQKELEKKFKRIIG